MFLSDLYVKRKKSQTITDSSTAVDVLPRLQIQFKFAHDELLTLVEVFEVPPVMGTDERP